jgi:hypothetical protein
MGGRYVEGLTEVEKALRVASNIGESFYMDRLLLTRALEIGQTDKSIEAGLNRSL